MADWAPRAGVDVAQRRAGMLGAARRYFAEQGVLEVDVPFLSGAAVSDPNIDSIEVRTALTALPAFLHTSPEYAMKRLLAHGFPDIACISRVFRDGEAGRRHQPEFTMIEWYRLGYELDAMIEDTLRLLGRLLDDALAVNPPVRLSYRDAFATYLDLDPLAADVSRLGAAAAADDALRSSIGDDRNAWLDLLLATRIAPEFPKDGFTVLYHYPADQAALARLSPADPTVADRFEVYLGETELANGYVELTDAREQRRRFDRDQACRRAAGRRQAPVDERLLAAIEAGLPQCAGVAVGFERLLMLNAGVDDIRDVYHFCWDQVR